MKFCPYCGKQLQDNEVCSCRTQTTAPVQQPVQPPVQQPVQQSPYAAATPAQPMGENKFVKALKELPNVLKSFLKDAKNTVNIAKANNDLMIAIVLSIVFFIAVFLSNCFISLGLEGSVKSMLGMFGMFGGAVSLFHFPQILVTSVVMTALIIVMFVLVTFLSNKLFNKEADVKKCIVDAFITFSVYSIPASAGLLLAGLTGFLSIYLLFTFVMFTIVYLVFVLAQELKANEGVSSTKFTLLNVLFITIALAVVVYAGFNMTLWCLDLGGLIGSAVSGIGGSMLGSLLG